MENKTPGDSMIQQKACHLKTTKIDKFYTMLLHSICAQFGKDPTDIREFLFNISLWNQFASDC